MNAPPSVSLLHHALKLLSIRPRSRHELTLRLTQICEKRKRSLRPVVRGAFSVIDCGAAARVVVEGLAEDGHLDDRAYAAWHAEQRALHRPRSRIKLSSELHQRGISSSLATEECGKVDERRAAAAVAKRKSSLSDDSLLKVLLRQGFPLRAATAAVRMRRSALDSEPLELESEDVSDTEI